MLPSFFATGSMWQIYETSSEKLVKTSRVELVLFRDDRSRVLYVWLMEGFSFFFFFFFFFFFSLFIFTSALWSTILREQEVGDRRSQVRIIGPSSVADCFKREQLDQL